MKNKKIQINWLHVLLFIFQRVLLYPFVYKNFIQAYLNTFRLHSSQVVYSLRSGLQYSCRGGPEDIGTLDEVFIKRMYDKPGYEILPNDIVIDIGAYIGDFSIFAAQKAYLGTVFAFEPISSLRKLVQTNTRLNAVENILLFPFGLAAHSGLADFHIRADKPAGDTSMYSGTSGLENYQKEKSLVISATNFFSVMKSIRPTYLKIDCEGSEFGIIYNLPESFWSTIRVAIVEYHDIFADEQNNSVALQAFMSQKGFQIERSKYDIFKHIGILYCRKLAE